MAKIRGRLPAGQLIEGVEVFRRLYTAIGFGWIVALTRGQATPGTRATHRRIIGLGAARVQRKLLV